MIGRIVVAERRALAPAAVAEDRLRLLGEGHDGRDRVSGRVRLLIEEDGLDVLVARDDPVVDRGGEEDGGVRARSREKRVRIGEQGIVEGVIRRCDLLGYGHLITSPIVLSSS